MGYLVSALLFYCLRVTAVSKVTFVASVQFFLFVFLSQANLHIHLALWRTYYAKVRQWIGSMHQEWAAFVLLLLAPEDALSWWEHVGGK